MLTVPRRLDRVKCLIMGGGGTCRQLLIWVALGWRMGGTDKSDRRVGGGGGGSCKSTGGTAGVLGQRQGCSMQTIGSRVQLLALTVIRQNRLLWNSMCRQCRWPWKLLQLNHNEVNLKSSVHLRFEVYGFTC